MKTKNDIIYINYISGKITLKTAWAMIKKLPKPWHTKEWKDKRSAIIKDKCEKCNKGGIMVINHYWHPPSSYQIKMEYIKRNLTFDQSSFLKWESMAKKTKAWPHILKDGVQKRFLSSIYIKDIYYKKNKNKIEDHVFKQSYKNHKKYMSMEDTETLCKSCASKYDYHVWSKPIHI